MKKIVFNRRNVRMCVYIGHIFALDKQLIDSARVASPCLGLITVDENEDFPTCLDFTTFKGHCILYESTLPAQV